MARLPSLAFLLGVLSIPSTPAWPAESSKLRIAAASDLRFALEEAMAGFRAANPNAQVEATYGSSGNFFAQVRQGAPFDVFLSADSESTRRLAAEGLSEAPFPYAIGRLALIVRRDSGLDPKSLGDLLKSAAIRRIGIANPAHAPYGRAAEAALRSWRIYDLVATRLVYGDSVSQAAQFVDTGAAQAALVALALVKGRSGPSDLVFAEVPQSAHPPIDQTGVIVKRTTSLDLARAFQVLLVGESGRAILQRYGFGLPAR